jgi:hypothetical protein
MRCHFDSRKLPSLGRRRQIDSAVLPEISAKNSQFPL